MMLLRVFMVFSIIVTAMASRLPRSNEDSIEGYQKCIARNGEEGLCVIETLCTEEHTIAPGGDLQSSEISMELSGFGFKRIIRNKTGKNTVRQEKYIEISKNIFKFPTPSSSIYIN